MLPDFETMTINELKIYAKDNNIDLGDAKKKADILLVIQNKYNNEEGTEMSEELKKEMDANTEVDTNLPKGEGTGEGTGEGAGNSEGNGEGGEGTGSEGTDKAEDKRTWTDAAGNEISMSQFIREQFTKFNKSRKEIADTYKINYRTVYGATVNMENEAEPSTRGRGVVNPKIKVTVDNKVLTTVVVDEVPAVEAVPASEGVEAVEAVAAIPGYTKYFLNNVEIVANEAGEIVVPETVETDRNTWIKDQVAAGANRGDIAKALDLSYGVVYGLTKEEDGTRQKYEVEFEVEEEVEGVMTKVTKTMARSEYIRKRVNEGASKSDVAKELGVEYSVVWQATKKEKADADKLVEAIEAVSKFADKIENPENSGNKEAFLAAIEALKAFKIVEPVEEKEEAAADAEKVDAEAKTEETEKTESEKTEA